MPGAVHETLRRVALSSPLIATALLAGVAFADPPMYEVEFLDPDVLEAPNDVLPEGGRIFGPASSGPYISSNGRFVAGTVSDEADPVNRGAVYRIDRSTDTVEFFSELVGTLRVFAVNDRGDMVVQSISGQGEIEFWSDDTGRVAFGDPSTVPAPLYVDAVLRILNDDGQVLVRSLVAPNAAPIVLWSPRLGTRLPIDASGFTFIVGQSLNDRGEVVGAASFDGVNSVGFVWDSLNGTAVLEGQSNHSATAINDSGTIAGTDRVSGLIGLAATQWPDAQSVPVDLPCGALPQCAALWINEAGLVVGGGGVFDDGVVEQGMLWDGSDPHLLNDLLVGVDEGLSCGVTSLADTGELAGGCAVPGTVGGLALLVPVVDGEDLPPVVSDVRADPNPVPVNAPVTLTAELDDSVSGASDIVSAAYTVDGGVPVAMSASDGAFDSSIETAIAAVAGFDTAGVYEICVTAEDAAGNSSEPSCILLAVYDPAAGFVTGGGWIDSPAGAYRAVPDLAGRANFGFVAKYKKGAQIPDGSTEFQFQAGDLNFHSSAYDWLVVTGGGTARFKGSGTINGLADGNGNPYKFMIWAADGLQDGFRIRIWREHGGLEDVIYDSGLVSLGGGSIVIHRR